MWSFGLSSGDDGPALSSVERESREGVERFDTPKMGFTRVERATRGLLRAGPSSSSGGAGPSSLGGVGSSSLASGSGSRDSPIYVSSGSEAEADSDSDVGASSDDPGDITFGDDADCDSDSSTLSLDVFRLGSPFKYQY